jgi:hypothetical protein
MKSFLITLIFSVLTISIWGQTIVDTAFANAIRKQCPHCIQTNNQLTQSAPFRENLSLNGLHIADLQKPIGDRLLNAFCKIKMFKNCIFAIFIWLTSLKSEIF